MFKLKTILKDDVIMFLDYDGVLHPLGSRADKEFMHLHYILKIIQTNPNLKIILTTSWLLSMDSKKVCDFLIYEKIKSQVIGCLITQSYHRGNDIRKLIAQNRLDNPWFIVDDASCFNPEDPLIKIDSWIGLTDDNYKLINEVIKNPLEYRQHILDSI